MLSSEPRSWGGSIEPERNESRSAFIIHDDERKRQIYSRSWYWKCEICFHSLPREDQRFIRREQLIHFSSFRIHSAHPAWLRRFLDPFYLFNMMWSDTSRTSTFLWASFARCFNYFFITLKAFERISQACAFIMTFNRDPRLEAISLAWCWWAAPSPPRLLPFTGRNEKLNGEVFLRLQLNCCWWISRISSKLITRVFQQLNQEPFLEIQKVVKNSCSSVKTSFASSKHRSECGVMVLRLPFRGYSLTVVSNTFLSHKNLLVSHWIFIKPQRRTKLKVNEDERGGERERRGKRSRNVDVGAMREEEENFNYPTRLYNSMFHHCFRVVLS